MTILLFSCFPAVPLTKRSTDSRDPRWYVKIAHLLELLLIDFVGDLIFHSSGNVFQGFSEQPISFTPSYKFDLHSDVYDSSEKRRVPSWTVRPTNSPLSIHAHDLYSTTCNMHASKERLYMYMYIVRFIDFKATLCSGSI